MKTWKILSWDERPEATYGLDLPCPHCGTEARLEVGNLGSPVIAAIGLSLVFDDPDNVPVSGAMPNVIKCRTCRRIYDDQEMTGLNREKA